MVLSTSDWVGEKSPTAAAPEEMVKVRGLRGVYCDGVPHRPGDFFAMRREDAADAVLAGKVEIVDRRWKLKIKDNSQWHAERPAPLVPDEPASWMNR